MNTSNPVYWFIFHQDMILLQKKGENYTIPQSIEPPVAVGQSLEIHFPEEEEEAEPARAARIQKLPEATADYLFINFRASWDLLDQTLFDKAGRASQLLYWDSQSRYCPACGQPTRQTSPIAKECPACRKELYPVISTAILALVRREDALLLVRANNFKGTFHSLVAGFLEAGETLEQCVAREVLEETGLTVNNITYFSNQPWPFPSGLMVGFICDYVSGEIRLQEEELNAAAFYTRENLPELPKKLSLARRMIDWWLTDQATKSLPQPTL